MPRMAAMDGKRTAGWYLARITLAIGIAAVLSVGWLFLSQAPFVNEFMPLRPLPLLAGFLGTLFGGIWIIRISRGTRDDPPPWRYRDR